MTIDMDKLEWPLAKYREAYYEMSWDDGYTLVIPVIDYREFRYKITGDDDENKAREAYRRHLIDMKNHKIKYFEDMSKAINRSLSQIISDF